MCRYEWFPQTYVLSKFEELIFRQKYTNPQKQQTSLSSKNPASYVVSNLVHIRAKYKNNGGHVEYLGKKIGKFQKAFWQIFVYACQ